MHPLIPCFHTYNVYNGLPLYPLICHLFFTSVLLLNTIWCHCCKANFNHLFNTSHTVKCIILHNNTPQSVNKRSTSANSVLVSKQTLLYLICFCRQIQSNLFGTLNQSILFARRGSLRVLYIYATKLRRYEANYVYYLCTCIPITLNISTTWSLCLQNAPHIYKLV